MNQARLSQITFQFPAGQPEADAFFSNLARLLDEVPKSTLESDQLVIEPSRPADTAPRLAIRQANVNYPTVVFETVEPLELAVGNLLLHGSSVMGRASAQPAENVEQGSERLLMKALYDRLQRHIVRLDHLGVNIPAALVDRETWDSLIRQVAGISNIYRYPTGEEWPFILPSTDAEFEDDITQFPPGREPKFELVYDEHSQEPTLQIDVGTNLTRQELEELLPEPYGQTFPGVGEYFRSVFVAHPWPGLAIRLDLRYRSEGEPDVWETGEWLVTEGKRIR
jgi:hypothetical protein